jgi:hypothetical protein
MRPQAAARAVVFLTYRLSDVSGFVDVSLSR